MTLRDIIEEAKKLPRDEQVDLIDELYCMINTNRDDVALTPAQAQDLKRRLEEGRSGKDDLIPGDEAIAMLRNRKRS
ncbi:MAG: putative addiction module component [Humisphaera sp.]|nr:putative addiction module component [Humisphaera sp.]